MVLIAHRRSPRRRCGSPHPRLALGRAVRAFVDRHGAQVVFRLGAHGAADRRRSSLRAPRDAYRLKRRSTGLRVPSAARVALLLSVASARRLRDVRGLSILCQRLQEEDARPQAAAALDRLLNRQRHRDEQRYIALVLMAIGPLTQAGMWADARERLQGLDEVALSESQAVLRDQALATCELQFDDPDAAQRAIDRIRRPDRRFDRGLVGRHGGTAHGRQGRVRKGTRAPRRTDAPTTILRFAPRIAWCTLTSWRNAVVPRTRSKSCACSERRRGAPGFSASCLPAGPASPLAEQLLNEADQSD